MKPITQYQSDNGHVFKTAEECANYETLLRQIDEAELTTIGPRIDSCDFTNGSGYIQHDQESFGKYTSEFCRLVSAHRNGLGREPFGYIGRVLSDGSSPIDSALYGMWCRLVCIDGQFREWGQPYYCEHPEKAQQKQLN